MSDGGSWAERSNARHIPLASRDLDMELYGNYLILEHSAVLVKALFQVNTSTSELGGPATSGGHLRYVLGRAQGALFRVEAAEIPALGGGSGGARGTTG